MPSLLLVENHAPLAHILARFLQDQENLEVAAVVHSGEAALAQLPLLSVDLVLTDLSLPGMSGIKLVASIREQNPELPCLMLSGHKEESYVRQAMQAGAQGYVIKGDPPALLEAIRLVLAGETYLSSELLE